MDSWQGFEVVEVQRLLGMESYQSAPDLKTPVLSFGMDRILADEQPASNTDLQVPGTIVPKTNREKGKMM